MISDTQRLIPRDNSAVFESVQKLWARVQTKSDIIFQQEDQTHLDLIIVAPRVYFNFKVWLGTKFKRIFGDETVLLKIVGNEVCIIAFSEYGLSIIKLQIKKRPMLSLIVVYGIIE